MRARFPSGHDGEWLLRSKTCWFPREVAPEKLWTSDLHHGGIGGLLEDTPKNFPAMATPDRKK